MKPQLTILVVDDISRNRTLLIQQLKHIASSTQSHYIFAEAESGDDAVFKVLEKVTNEKTNYDLIFMDFNMPGSGQLLYGNGEESTIAIRAIEKEGQLSPSKIVTYTSTNPTQPFRGADIILSKPSTLTNLIAILRALKLLSDEHLSTPHK